MEFIITPLGLFSLKIYHLIGIWIPITNLGRTFGHFYTRKMASLLVYRGPISYHVRIWSRHIFDFSQLELIPNTEQMIYTGKCWLRRHIWCSFVQRHFTFCISINKTTIHVTYVRCHQTCHVQCHQTWRSQNVCLTLFGLSFVGGS